MSLRRKLALSVIAILILFSINVVTDSWSFQQRAKNIDILRQAVSSQIKTAIIKEKITDQHKAILLRSSLRSTLAETMTARESRQSLQQLEKISADIQALYTDKLLVPENLEMQLQSVTLTLFPLWKNFYRQYNNPLYDHLKEAETRDISYSETVKTLNEIEEAFIKIADQQSVDINNLETLTNRITISVFITTLILTVGLGFFLIRHVNNALAELKKGTVIIGRGNLDYRIPVTTSDELGQLGTAFNDMSEKMKITMEELRLAQENADQANRAKSSFLANMSHELRTPLNAVIGYSEMLLEDIDSGSNNPEEQKKDLEKILHAGRNLLQHINDVLDLSKIETGKMTLFRETFSPGEMLKDVIETITPLAQKQNNQIIYREKTPLPSLVNDITRFQQIFFNLLSNACKFTEQGQITVVSEFIADCEPGKLRIKVSDTGIGMTVDQLLVVFEAFVQADSSTTRKYGGTGLGLALCKQYCELMGGEIQVESIIDKGTTFTVEFPVSPETGTDNQDPPTTDVAFRQIKQILVIDDDPVALALTQRFLGKSDYDILVANSGKDGLAIAEERQPDLILLDIMMPGLNGLNVLTVLKASEKTAHIPVFLVSMLDEESVGLTVNTEGFHQKPVKWEKLLSAIETLFDRQYPPSSAAVQPPANRPG